MIIMEIWASKSLGKQVLYTSYTSQTHFHKIREDCLLLYVHKCDWRACRDERRWRPASRRYEHRAPTFSTAETYTMLNAFEMQVLTQVWTKTDIVLQYTDSACFAWLNGENLTITVVSRKRAHSWRAPTPYFWPIFLHGVKVYLNEHPPWSELRVEFEKHSLAYERYAYLG